MGSEPLAMGSILLDMVEKKDIPSFIPLPTNALSIEGVENEADLMK
jgi:hypothetical protein